MAGKVNTKFVVLLCVGLVAVFGLLALAFGAMVFKSGDDYARLGDAAMAEGDYGRATRMYERAVGHDTTNPVWLEKWITAMESWTPATETAYKNAFFQNYLGAVSQVASAQQTNLESHERLLDLVYANLELSAQEAGGRGRSLADRVAQLATEAAAYFERDPSADPAWKRLLRYRGLARQAVLAGGGVLTDAEVALIPEDLRAALEADPSDGESAAALMRWTQMTAARNARADAAESMAAEGRREAREIGERFLAEHPDSVPVRLQMLLVELSDLQAVAASMGEDPAARIEAVAARQRELVPRLDEIAALMEKAGPDGVALTSLSVFARLETILDPQGRAARSRGVIEGFLEERPEDVDLLGVAALAAREVGDLEAAAAWMARIEALPVPPLGQEGVRRFEMKRTALMMRAETVLDLRERLGEDGDPAEREELLATARSLRDQFASQVSEDHPSLAKLDGRLAEVDGELAEALRLFKRYNEQSRSSSAEGYMLEARVAERLGQSGTARDALSKMLELDSTDMRAMIWLARTEQMLQNNRRAAELYQQVLRLDPNNEMAQAGMRSIRESENPDLIEDPVMSVVMRSRRMRAGTENTPADPAGGMRLLSDSLERFGYDPRIASELAEVRANLGDLDGARAVVVEAKRRHPEEPRLARLESILGSDNLIEARYRIIEESGLDETERLVAVASLALGQGEAQADRLEQTLTRLEEIAPDHPGYIDVAFAWALTRGRTAEAERLARKAEQGDVDRVRGLTYRARLAAAGGDHNAAVEHLRQATALGTSGVFVQRLLAVELREAGRLEESIAAFNRALEIAPDDGQTILEYVSTLARAGRTQQALDVARRLQRFAMNYPPFVELWLSLEGMAGGQEGLALAVRQRERMLEINPADRNNRVALARLYMDQKRWPDAKPLIDQLRAERDELRLVELIARWFAEQGRVDGREGLALAQEAYRDFVATLDDAAAKTEAMLSLARFGLSRGRPDLAVAAADEAVATEGESMAATKFRGDLMMSFNQPGPAAEAFRKVVDAGADTPEHEFRERLIEMYLRMGSWDEAEAELGKLPASKSSGLVNMLQRSAIAEGRGDTARQREILDEAVSRFPREPLVYIRRAESMLGDPRLTRDLEADVEAALRLRPQDPRALQVRAQMYLREGREREALADQTAALRADPSQNALLFSVLNSLLEQDRVGEAMDLAREVLDARPTDGPLMAELGQLFKAREMWERSAEMFGRAWRTRKSASDGVSYIDMLLRSNPPNAGTANDVLNELAQMVGGNMEQNPGLLSAQALVLRARGREDFALQQMTKAFNLSLSEDNRLLAWAQNAVRFYRGMTPESELGYYRSLMGTSADPRTRAWLELFTAQRQLELGVEPARAMSELERLSNLDSAPELVRRLSIRSMGNEHYQKGRYEEAVGAWRRALEQTPDDWELNNNIAYTLATRMDRAAEALPLAERAVETGVSRSEPYDTLASIYIAMDKLSEAEQMLERGLRMTRSDVARATIFKTAARLSLARGDKAQARQSIERAKRMLRSSTARDSTLDEQIEAIEREIGSEG